MRGKITYEQTCWPLGSALKISDMRISEFSLHPLNRQHDILFLSFDHHENNHSYNNRRDNNFRKHEQRSLRIRLGMLIKSAKT